MPVSKVSVLLLAGFIIGATWWPSHKYFTWLHSHHHSSTTLVGSILGCAVLTIIVVFLGYDIGQHIHNLTIRSLDSEGGGLASSINLFWFPFALLALGVWAGFLSGYLRMKVIDN